MSAVETWPLSAAATQLLVDLRHDGPAVTLNTTLARLTVKELILRGQLRVLSVRTRWMGTPAIRVAWGGAPAESLPLTAATLARRLPTTDDEDLAQLLREARRLNHDLFHKDLRAAAYGELSHHGFVERQFRKSFGIWPSSFIGPTSAGDEARQQALAGAPQGVLTLLTATGLAAALPELAADLGLLEDALERITSTIDKNVTHAVDLHNSGGGGASFDASGGCGASSGGGSCGGGGGCGGGGCGGGGA